MKKYPSFKIDFLGCKISVIIDKNWKKIGAKILDRPLTKEEGINGLSIDMDREYYILAASTVSDGILYHECIHILIWLADAYGLIFSADTQEFMAYLCEYMLNEILKIKKQTKSKK